MEYERPEMESMINLFVTLKMLRNYYSMDQALEILDVYLKSGNIKVITTQDDIRDFVAKSNILESFQPIYEEGYKHLSDYIEDISPKKQKSK